MTKIIKIDPINPDERKIKEAAKVIKDGGTVAFPTETVYGIGANAFDDHACNSIFEAKSRPADNPLIVHISSISQLPEVAKNISQDFYKITKRLWPGPVTFILDKNSKISKVATCGLDTLAVRMPAHTIAQKLIEFSGVPIAAPSANIATKPSATRFEDVVEDFDGRVDIIIDGGDAFFGIESTIVDTRGKDPLILRPGALGTRELERYIHRIRYDKRSIAENNAAPIAPGMKYRHYAPSTRFILIEDKGLLVKSVEKSIKAQKKIGVICSDHIAKSIENYNSHISVIRLGDENNYYQIAKNLFSSFRELDRKRVELGIIHSFREEGIGLAIMNRIRKAASFEVGSLKEFDSIVENKRRE